MAEDTNTEVEENIEDEAGQVTDGEGIDSGAGAGEGDALQAGSEAGEGEAPETFEVKVNGEIQKVTLEDLQKNYSLGTAAHSKMQEASNLQKQAIEFIQALKNDPLSVLTDERLGLDFGAVVDQFNQSKSEYENMSEEQQQLLLAQRQLQQYKVQQDQYEAQKREQFQSQQVQQITQEIDAAIELGGMPNNTFVFNRYIEYLTTAEEKGLNVAPAALTELVMEDYKEAMSDMLGKSAPEELISLLGDRVKDIRKYEVDKLKGDDTRVTKKGEKPTQKKDESEMGSLEDFKESLGIFG